MNSSNACGITRRIEEMQHVTFDNSDVEKKQWTMCIKLTKSKL
jgi:hypothetical protein